MNTNTQSQQAISRMFEEAAELLRQDQYREAVDIAERARGQAQSHFGEASTEHAKALHDLGVVLSAADDVEQLDNARQMFEAACAIQTEVAGSENWRYAYFTFDLGELWLRLDDLVQAEAYLLAAYRIFQAVGVEQVEPIFRLSIGYGFGPGSEASVTFTIPEEDGTIVEEKPSKPSLQHEMNRQITHALHNLAISYQQLGDYRKAIPLYERSLEVKRRIYYAEDDPLVTNSLIELGWVNHSVGNYEAASSIFHQALANVRSYNQEFRLGESGISDLLNDLAIVRYESGDYATAMRLMREALELDSSTLGDDDLAVSRDLEHLGWLHYGIGNYAEAEASYDQALQITRSALEDDSVPEGTICNRLALVHSAQGKYASAEDLFSEALRVYALHEPEDHPRVAECRHNLARLYQDLGRYTEAEELIHDAMQVLRRTRGDHHPYVTGCLADLGQLSAARGDYANAESCFLEALEKDLDVLGENHLDVADIRSLLAQIYAATGRVEEAYELLVQATHVEDMMIDQVFSVGTERQRIAYLDLIRGRFYAFLSLALHHLSQNEDAVRSAFELSIRRKGIGAELLMAQQDAVLNTRYSRELNRRYQELKTLRLQIAKKALSGPGVEGLQVHEQLLAGWQQEREQIEAALAEQMPEMKVMERLEIDHQAVSEILPIGSALVEFVYFHVYDFYAISAQAQPSWHSARYVAFVLPSGEPDKLQMFDLGEAKPIDRMIAEYRKLITGEMESVDKRDAEAEFFDLRQVSLRSEKDSLRTAITTATRHLRPLSIADSRVERIKLGTALRKALFDPLLPAMTGCSRLILAPDGDLARLPFEVLPMEDGRYLIDDFQINYLSVGRDILRFREAAKGQPTDPLVVVDPDFDLTNSEEPSLIAGYPFPRLTGALKEGEAIGALLDQEHVSGSEALESTIKSCLSPHILHIASHGFFFPNAPRDPNEVEPAWIAIGGWEESRLTRLAQIQNPLLRSALTLAGANTWLQEGKLPEEAEDGLLTAEDVSGLDLLATELVVLSACDTGLGEVQVGEGVFGLRRAFVLAGAKTLVMSLWKVPDQQTQELMVDFYQRILKGQPRTEALRGAQLAMKEKHPDPFHWGAFICQGDPGPLR